MTQQIGVFYHLGRRIVTKIVIPDTEPDREVLVAGVGRGEGVLRVIPGTDGRVELATHQMPGEGMVLIPKHRAQEMERILAGLGIKLHG